MPDAITITMAIITSAIRTRRLIRFRYHGAMRTLIPLVYGHGRAGQELLRGWQLSGPPRAGERRGWKLMRVADISDLVGTTLVFTASQIPADYNPDDPLITAIICRVPPPSPSRRMRRDAVLDG